MEIDGNLITISIEKTRNKNMYLRVREDGSLLCSVPYGTSEKIIQSFIESRANWIKKTQKVIQKRNEMNAIVLYPTFRIRFELLKKMQERENNTVDVRKAIKIV